MKKKLSFFFAVAVLLLTGQTVMAQTFTVGDLSFTVTDADAKTVSVKKTDGISGNVVIPASVTNEGVTYAVTSVVDNGFASTAITGVTIPASVTSLGSWAFRECGSLASITIEDSDEPLALVAGYYSSFAWSTADKTVYIGRDFTLTGGNTPFSDVTSVVFSNKVTTIPNSLFYGNTKLQSITIGDGVTTIGSSAFSSVGTDDGVEELQVTLGSNIEIIKNDAFNSCSKLKAITLPSKLKVIEQYAFSTTGLTAITIPESVDSLGSCVFGECHSLANIHINDKAEALKMIAGYYGTFNYSEADKSVYLGRDLKLSENSAPFINVTAVEFGPTITAISDNMFRDVTKLKSVIIGDGVTTIGSYAFYNVGTDDGVEELQVTLGSNIETIKNDAFNSCTKLKAITLPSKLKVIEQWAFSSTALESITIPESVDSLGSRVFGECHSLANIHINDKAEALKMIAGYYGTFNYSEADKSVYLGRDLKLSENSAPFINVTAVEFGPTITAISDNMFRDVTKLKSVIIGDGVTTIGSYAFYNVGTDDGVEELQVTLGSNIETIKNDAFNSCSKLKAITLPSKLKVIEQYAFNATALEAIIIPESVDSLGSRVFGGCNSLANIHINDKAEALKMVAGYYGTFAYEDVEVGKTIYIGRDLKLSENSGPFSYPEGSQIKSVTFGDMVTTITPYMLNGASKMGNLVIGNGVTTIGSYAFYGVGTDDSIEELQVTMGANVETIGAGIFQNCSKLKQVILPATLNAIPNETFSGTGLTAVSIPAKTTSVGQRAFAFCNNLTDITIEDGTEPLEFAVGYYGVFYSSDATDKNVYVGRNLTYTDGEQLVSNIATLELGPQLTTIKNKMFDGSTLTSVKVSWIETLTSCPENAFNADTYSGATLWVPGGTMEAYKAADYWKNFTNMDYWSFVVSATVTGKGTLALANGEAVTSNGTNTEKSVTGTSLVSAGATEPVSGLFVREKDLTLTSTPALGYELSALTANDADIKAAGKVENLLADQTISATFNPIIYPITYTLAGGSVETANPTTYTIESAAITLNNPTRKGYTFEGWTGTDLTEPTKTVTIPAGSIGERSYTATWKVITYNLTYNLAGGAVATENPTTYTIESAAITLNNPTRTGYTFEGWTGTDLTEPTKTVTIPAGSIGNRSYVATWEANPYKVSFDANGGDGGTMADQNFVYDTAQNLTENAFTRTGYTFTGWNSKADGTGTPYADKQEVVNLTATRDAVVTMYAQWQPITYYVSFDKNGGTGTDMIVQKFVYDTAQPLSENAYTRTGYNFKEWTTKADGTGDKFTDKQSVKNLSATQDEVVTIYAQWNAINYTIAYDLAGGEVATANPESYTIETATFTLNNPTRSGYTFKGWTGTELSGATMTVTIAKGSTGDRSYTATWERNAITLIDNADNSELLSAWDGKVADVTLSGRTFTKNGQWNTICLPFDLTIAGSVLDGAEVRTLASTTLAGQNLTMTFSDNLTEMEAGKPYVIRWASGEPLVNPTFEGVTVKNANVKTNSITTDYVTFTGTYTPTALTKDDVSNLYLGSNNTLYYPNVDGFKVNAFRGFFKVDDSATAMGLNIITDLGDGSTTRIQNAVDAESELDSWYTLNGVKLDSKPTQKGVFIHNGTKVVIK